MRMKMLAAAGAVAVLAIGCGSSASTARKTPHYSSVQQIGAALKKGHLPCSGMSASGTPVVAGATSEALCDLSKPGAGLIDVFPSTATITTNTVLKNSVSTGSEEIWNVVGPNWIVQTTQGYAKRIQKIHSALRVYRTDAIMLRLETVARKKIKGAGHSLMDGLAVIDEFVG